ncbi:carbonic anhydrase, partial [Trichoderma reesei RUT C-30]
LLAVTCCDPRVLPDRFFGGIGMKFSEVRNAGGRASEALRSIICVDQMLGVGAVIVIHHTDCGLTHLRNDYLHKSLTEKAPKNAEEIAEMEFGEIVDLKASVVEDMKILKDSPYLRKNLKVYGYVYDIKTGKLQEVKE